MNYEFVISMEWICSSMQIDFLSVEHIHIDLRNIYSENQVAAAQKLNQTWDVLLCSSILLCVLHRRLNFCTLGIALINNDSHVRCIRFAFHRVLCDRNRCDIYVKKIPGKGLKQMNVGNTLQLFHLRSKLFCWYRKSLTDVSVLNDCNWSSSL